MAAAVVPLFPLTLSPFDAAAVLLCCCAALGVVFRFFFFFFWCCVSTGVVFLLVLVVVLCPGIGGGAYLDGLNATLSNCRFERNHAEGNDLFGQLASFGGGLATRGPLCLTNIR